MTGRGLLIAASLLVGCAGDDGAPVSSTTGGSSETSADTVATTTGPDVDCPVDGDLGPGLHTVELQHGGLMRDALVYVPDAYDPTVATAVVLNMHGLLSNPDQQREFAGLEPTADAEGFVIVYPRGTDNSWNAGSCCGEAAAMGVDDVGFVRAVVQTVSDQLCVDPGRVYATGMSNGGYMSHRLACEAADMFAAVAPVAGAMGIPDCTPERPVPVVAFHGTEDTLVTYEQGRAAIDQWLALDGCPAGPTEVETFGGSRCEIWRDCDDGVEVQLCTLDPMGHCWPGGSEQLCIGIIGPYSDEIDANARLWSVMSRYRLP